MIGIYVYFRQKQVGRTIESIYPSKQNKERVLYVSEIGESLYIVDGTLDNHTVQGFKVLKSNVVDFRKQTR